MSGRLGMTDAEFDRALAPFAREIERGYEATLTLRRLAADEGFRQRYLKGDAAAVELYDRLSAVRAAGTQPYRDAVGAMQDAAAPATNGAVLALINDADFVGRYMAGDVAARAEWDAASASNTTAAEAAEGNGNA